MKRFFHIPIMLVALLATACSNDFGQPSFFSVGHIDFIPPTENAHTTDSGFYTSDIVAAYVVAHYPNRQAVDTVGLFRLPFTIPLLYEGDVDYIDIYPAVPQSGKMNTLPFYTFYNRRHITNCRLSAGDTLRFDTLCVTYNSKNDFPLLFVSFEPIDPLIHMDSVQWITGDAAGACTGTGYVKVHVNPDEDHRDFAINMGGIHDNGTFDFMVADASKLIYLEFDIRSDVEMAVRMSSRLRSESNPEIKEVMRTNPTAGEWHHFYVNLGRTWSYFNYYRYFSISFSALNVDGVGGDVCLDNVRLLTTSVTL